MLLTNETTDAVAVVLQQQQTAKTTQEFLCNILAERHQKKRSKWKTSTLNKKSQNKYTLQKKLYKKT